MNALQAQAMKTDIQNWVRVKGIRHVMKLTAMHLLPGKKFDFILNVGGGSYTDGKEVVVGIPELTFPMDKEIVFSATKALVGHETEHVMSSDFKVFRQFQEDVKAYFKKHYNLKLGSRLGAHMLNATEDGRIEKRLINRYGGYKKHIQLLNGIFWNGQPTTGENEMIEFLYCITSICVTGLKKKDWEKVYGGTEQDLLLDEIRPMIMKAINNRTAKGCADDTMEIVKVIAPYMARMLEDLKNQQELEKEINDTPDFQSSNPQEGAGSQPGTANTSHFLEEEDDKKKSGKPNEDENESDDESDEKSDEESDENSDGTSKDESDDEDEESSVKGELDTPEDEEIPDSDDSDENEGEDGSEESNESDKEQESEPAKQDDAPSDEPELSPEDIERMIQEMVENLKDEVAEEAEQAMKQGEREAEKEMAREQQENQYTGHLTEDEIKGIDSRVAFRQVDPIHTRQKSVPSEVLKNGKLVNKELRQIFMNKQTYTSRNRRNGQLDTGSLWKLGVKDYNTFIKKGVPNDTDYAVSVLVDASGSMEEPVDRFGTTKLTKAYEATAMIEEALRDLVPTRITFFTSLWGGTVVHSTVKDFDQKSKDTLSWKRIPALENMGNRDGYSIMVATRELQKRKERKKMLIVLSDGAPSDQGEVNRAVREARKEGILVVAIAFGSKQEMERNKPVYEGMYQKGIIMVQPDEIHKHLSKVIKSEVSR